MVMGPEDCMGVARSARAGALGESALVAIAERGMKDDPGSPARAAGAADLVVAGGLDSSPTVFDFAMSTALKRPNPTDRSIAGRCKGRCWGNWCPVRSARRAGQ